MQTLYIFTEGSIDLINTSSIKTAPGTNTLIYTSVPLETMEGAMSHNTIANVGKNVYFLTKSGKIKMVTPGQLTYDVSELSHRANR